ncbi:MAG TPA: glycosyltransferase family 4 protein, partial [Armatimonadetes bacterium]|nr:glycosyltransferase family 4 protein [Armatimonadota bacterium]
MGVMKVAFVSECYRPTRNGVVSSIETFRTHLTDLGCHVKIFAPAYPGYYDGQPDVHRFPSICFSSYTEYPIALPWAVAPWRQLNDFAPDIVHSHSVFWLTRMAGYWARHHHVPLVLTFHTLVTEYLHYVPLPRTLARWIVIRLIAQYSNWCDIVLVPTPAVIPILRNYGITADIEPLPTGIEVEQFQVG